MKAIAVRGIPPKTRSGDRAAASFSKLLGCLAVLGACCSGGCGGNGRGSTATLSIDPSAAAHKAIELYDKDSSGSLSEAELAAAAPGFLAALERYDRDGDRQISRDEIEQRLQSVASIGTSFLSVNCRVLQGGRPLAGAQVRFVPDECLENAILPASGTTEAFGQVNPAVAEDQLPDEKKGLRVMQPGIYRVQIEHPSVKQPHKPLGCEIDELARGGTDPVFNL